MPLIDQSSLHNRLLQRLAAEDFALLAPHLEPTSLHKDDVLFEPGQPFEHATFFESGIGSIITLSSNGWMVEGGLVGREGFTPTALALDVERSPWRCIVQVPGQAHRITVDALRGAMKASPTLHNVLLHFAHAMSVQVSCTALANTMALIEERLARWLLMSHDRVEGDEVALTHEFLSIMLAVRRPSVTIALHVLEGQGLVRTRPGLITVTDRRGLEAFAGDTYGRPEAEYERLLGPLR